MKLTFQTGLSHFEYLLDPSQSQCFKHAWEYKESNCQRSLLCRLLRGGYLQSTSLGQQVRAPVPQWPYSCTCQLACIHSVSGSLLVFLRLRKQTPIHSPDGRERACGRGGWQGHDRQGRQTVPIHHLMYTGFYSTN